MRTNHAACLLAHHVSSCQLGTTQDGEPLGDVVLPPWASSASDFVRQGRRALESDYVSKRLHLWVDLVFGAKQRGAAAVAADNLFFHLTYEVER